VAGKGHHHHFQCERCDRVFDISGCLDNLRRLLDAEPALVTMRSPFPHRQTLLQHVAANGIEVERQLQSPPNPVEVLRLLIERGADRVSPFSIPSIIPNLGAGYVSIELGTRGPLMS